MCLSLLIFAAVHKLTGKPNSLYDTADGAEDSECLLICSDTVIASNYVYGNKENQSRLIFFINYKHYLLQLSRN